MPDLNFNIRFDTSSAEEQINQLTAKLQAAAGSLKLTLDTGSIAESLKTAVDTAGVQSKLDEITKPVTVNIETNAPKAEADLEKVAQVHAAVREEFSQPITVETNTSDVVARLSEVAQQALGLEARSADPITVKVEATGAEQVIQELAQVDNKSEELEAKFRERLARRQGRGSSRRIVDDDDDEEIQALTTKVEALKTTTDQPIKINVDASKVFTAEEEVAAAEKMLALFFGAAEQPAKINVDTTAIVKAEQEIQRTAEQIQLLKTTSGPVNLPPVQPLELTAGGSGNEIERFVPLLDRLLDLKTQLSGAPIDFVGVDSSARLERINTEVEQLRRSGPLALFVENEPLNVLPAQIQRINAELEQIQASAITASSSLSTIAVPRIIGESGLGQFRSFEESLQATARHIEQINQNINNIDPLKFTVQREGLDVVQQDLDKINANLGLLDKGVDFSIQTGTLDQATEKVLALKARVEELRQIGEAGGIIPPGASPDFILANAEAIQKLGTAAEGPGIKELPSELAVAATAVNAFEAELTQLGLKLTSVKGNFSLTEDGGLGLTGIKAQVQEVEGAFGRVGTAQARLNAEGGIEGLSVTFKETDQAVVTTIADVGRLQSELAQIPNSMQQGLRFAVELQQVLAGMGVEFSRLKIATDSAGNLQGITGQVRQTLTDQLSAVSRVQVLPTGEIKILNTELVSTKNSLDQALAAARGFASPLLRAADAMQIANREADKFKQELIDAGLQAKQVSATVNTLGEVSTFTTEFANGDKATFGADKNLKSFSSTIKDVDDNVRRAGRGFGSVFYPALIQAGSTLGPVGSQAIGVVGGLIQIAETSPAAAVGLAALEVAALELKEVLRFEEGQDTVAAFLGGTAEDIEANGQRLQSALAGSTEDFKTTVEAFTILQRQLGDSAVGDQIAELTNKVTFAVSRLPGGSAGNVADLGQIFTQFKIGPGEEAAEFLDVLTFAVQRYSGNLTQLLNDIKSAGPTLRTLGLDPAQIIILTAKLEKFGVNVNEIEVGFSRLTNIAAQKGIPLDTFFEDEINKIKALKTNQEKLLTIQQDFGSSSRSGGDQKILDVINAGVFDDLKNVTPILDESRGALERTEKSAGNLGESFTKLRNQLNNAFGQADLGKKLETGFNAASFAAQGLIVGVGSLAGLFGSAFTAVTDLGVATSQVVRQTFGVIASEANSILGAIENAINKLIDKANSIPGVDIAKVDLPDIKVPEEIKIETGETNKGLAELGKNLGEATGKLLQLKVPTEEIITLAQRQANAQIALARAYADGNISQEEFNRISDETGITVPSLISEQENLLKVLNESALGYGAFSLEAAKAQSTLNDAAGASEKATLSLQQVAGGQQLLIERLADGSLSLDDYAGAAEELGVKVEDLVPIGNELTQQLQQLASTSGEAAARAIELALAMDQGFSPAERLRRGIAQVTEELAVFNSLEGTFNPTLSDAVSELSSGDKSEKKRNDAAKKELDRQAKDARRAADIQKDALDNQIDAIQKAAELQKRAIDDQIDAIDKQIDKLQEMSRVNSTIDAETRSRLLNEVRARQELINQIDVQLADSHDLVQQESERLRLFTDAQTADPTQARADATAREMDLINQLRNAESARVSDLVSQQATVRAQLEAQVKLLQDSAIAVRELSAEEQRRANLDRRNLRRQLGSIESEQLSAKRETDRRRLALNRQLGDTVGTDSTADEQRARLQEQLNLLDSDLSQRLAEIENRREEAQGKLAEVEGKIAGDVLARQLKEQIKGLEGQKDLLKDQKKNLENQTKDAVDALKDRKKAIDDQLKDFINGIDKSKDALDDATAALGDGVKDGAKKASVSIDEAFQQLGETFSKRQSILTDLVQNSQDIRHALQLIFDKSINLSADQRIRFADDLRNASPERRAALDAQAAEALAHREDIKGQESELAQFLIEQEKATVAERNAVVIGGFAQQLAEQVGFGILGKQQSASSGRESGEAYADNFGFYDAVDGSTITAPLDGLKGPIGEIGSQSGTRYKTGLETTASAFNPRTVLAGLTGTVSVAGQVGTDARRSFDLAFSGLGTGAANALGTALQPAYATASVAGQIAGRLYVLGFQLGIQDGSSGLAKIVNTAIFTAVIETVKTLLGIRSPSRVAMDQATHYMSGWEIGLASRSSHISAAATKALGPLAKVLDGHSAEVVAKHMIIPSDANGQGANVPIRLHPDDIGIIVQALRDGPLDKPTMLPRKPGPLR